MDIDMVNEIVTNEKLDMLCMLLYFTHKTKWDKLIEYSTKDYDPLHTSVSKSTREYGHVIDNTDGGSDETNSSVGLYGFDSTDPVPSDENTIKNSYGKTVKVTNSGNDVTTVERQSGLTSALWDNDLRFWEHNNVPITMVDDVFKSICDNLYLDRESLEDRLVN